MAKLSEATACFCAEYVGNYMYVAAKRENDFVNYRYHTVKKHMGDTPIFCWINQSNQLFLQCRQPFIRDIPISDALQISYSYKSVAMCR